MQKHLNHLKLLSFIILFIPILIFTSTFLTPISAQTTTPKLFQKNNLTFSNPSWTLYEHDDAYLTNQISRLQNSHIKYLMFDLGYFDKNYHTGNYVLPISGKIDSQPEKYLSRWLEKLKTQAPEIQNIATLNGNTYWHIMLEANQGQTPTISQEQMYENIANHAQYLLDNYPLSGLALDFEPFEIRSNDNYLELVKTIKAKIGSDIPIYIIGTIMPGDTQTDQLLEFSEVASAYVSMDYDTGFTTDRGNDAQEYIDFVATNISRIDAILASTSMKYFPTGPGVYNNTTYHDQSIENELHHTQAIWQAESNSCLNIQGAGTWWWQGLSDDENEYNPFNQNWTNLPTNPDICPVNQQTIRPEPSNDLIANPLMGAVIDSRENPNQFYEGNPASMYLVNTNWFQYSNSQNTFDFDRLIADFKVKRWADLGLRGQWLFNSDRGSSTNQDESNCYLCGWFDEKLFRPKDNPWQYDSSNLVYPDLTADDYHGYWYKINDGNPQFLPNYEHPDFINAHREFITQLGKYLNVTHPEYRPWLVQIGSVGLWGELHLGYLEEPALPSEELMKSYILPYKTAFPQSYLTLRRPIADLIKNDKSFGLHSHAYASYSNQLWWRKMALGDQGRAGFWQDIPVGGENYTYFLGKIQSNSQPKYPDHIYDKKWGSIDALSSSPCVSEVCRTEVAYDNSAFDGKYSTTRLIDYTISQYVDTHASYIMGQWNWFRHAGNSFPENTGSSSDEFYHDANQVNYLSNTHKLLKNIGYKLRIKEFTYPSTFKLGNNLPITLKMTNEGAAPFYLNYDLEISLKNKQTQEILWQQKIKKVGNQDFSLQNWQPAYRNKRLSIYEEIYHDNNFEIKIKDEKGQKNIIGELMINSQIPAGEYDILLAIVDPENNKPVVNFAIDQSLKTPDGRFNLGEINIAAGESNGSGEPENGQSGSENNHNLISGDSNNHHFTFNYQPTNCDSTYPVGTPTILNIQSVGANKLKVFFSATQSNYTSYTLIYGEKPNEMMHGILDFGNQDSREVIVDLLKPKQKYFFQIRANNSCQPGNWSNQYQGKTI